MSRPTGFPQVLFSRRTGLALTAAGLCFMGYGIFRGEMSVFSEKGCRAILFLRESVLYLWRIENDCLCKRVTRTY